MISFVTVTYNSNRTIAACLAAATGQPDSEVIVVDNDSQDGTVDGIRKQFPGVTLIESGRNLGFNGGNSLGVQAAKGDILVFLNPDAILPENYSETIERLFQELPDIGIIGVRTVYEDGAPQPSGNMFPTLGSLLYEHSAYSNFSPHSRAYAGYTIKGWDRKTSRRVDAVSGACMAVRRADLDAIGGLELGYFMYYEEFDLARSMRDKLRKGAYFTADIEVVHAAGESTKTQDTNKINGIYLASRDFYIKKFHGGSFLLVFKTLAWVINKAHGLASRLRRG
ncbi:glycosyltransferase family 2 protein [Catellatospora chokoriensis]|uniref:Glycosyl transferase n=1 Tax=Catellatospora chokoriensis TaxID=310353 RepID=A0A8J3NW86_9ACTN|nr:glycosyltransferase family 2 protein [Catellatospora chokoriensis]GIF94676.1 glycosyl transferase [Catellatospora chokoriensis]